MWLRLAKALVITAWVALLAACAAVEDERSEDAEEVVAIPDKVAERTIWDALADDRRTHHAGFMQPSRARQLTAQDSPLLSGPYLARSCQSDFDCPTNQACIKQVASTTGTCLIAVDRRGDPTTYIPNPASEAMPREPRCEGSGDCPVGFSCDRRLNACVR